jgi:hypothetical protein
MYFGSNTGTETSMGSGTETGTGSGTETGTELKYIPLKNIKYEKGNISYSKTLDHGFYPKTFTSLCQQVCNTCKNAINIPFSDRQYQDIVNIACRDCNRCRTFSNPVVAIADSTPTSREWFVPTREIINKHGQTREQQQLPKGQTRYTPLLQTIEPRPYTDNPKLNMKNFCFSCEGDDLQFMLKNRSSVNFLNFISQDRSIPNRYLSYSSNELKNNDIIQPDEILHIRT